MNYNDELLDDAYQLFDSLQFPRNLTFHEYMLMAKGTSIYPKEGLLKNLALGIAAETGEIANEIKKLDRDSGGEGGITDEIMQDLLNECGDVMWYLAVLIHALHGDMGEVAATNIWKLRDRQKRGVIGGSGDNR